MLICAGALATAGVAAATEGAHFTQGGDPVCTDIGLQLECTAEIAGLGQQQVVGTIKAPGWRAFIDATTESPSVSAKDPGRPRDSAG